MNGRRINTGVSSLVRNKHKISMSIQLSEHMRACSVPGVVGKAGMNETWPLPSRRAQQREEAGAQNLLSKY